MGVFDFLKKKEEPKKVYHNQLEVLLEKAASQPEVRLDFYRHLLADNLVVITQGSQLGEGEHVLQENTNVNIVSLTDGRIPVFTATERIFEKGVIKEQVFYLQMKGEDLFNIAVGATFILNPYSDFGKELLPDEIKDLLNGNIFSGNATTEIMQKDTQVMIGQPSDYPTDMLEAIKKLFSKNENVKAAYLAWIHIPENGLPPHYIIGVSINGDLHSTTSEAGLLAKQFLGPDKIIDFIEVGEGLSLSDYFLNNTTPFYTR